MRLRHSGHSAWYPDAKKGSMAMELVRSSTKPIRHAINMSVGVIGRDRDVRVLAAVCQDVKRPPPLL